VEGISPENAILVSYSPEPECCAGHFAGLVLTAEARFLEFDVELRLGRRAEVIDVTDETDTRERIPAIGTTDGHLALRLLETLTSEGMVHGRSL
jgi:hypothetical protein